ncbi:hypothetical protein BP5796_04148 [Coleophoma crateriformis]|uniref:Uncharacterized protein n=1 Tax=Coleophoma crateriformis TaxID=565419 RepID=A0A3D8SHQ0_9HELO|nr:hypothetical protein BP5796_04148 [Coleophoma crateriformis]
MSYPTPPLSSGGRQSPKVSSLPPYASQITTYRAPATVILESTNSIPRPGPYFPPYEAETPRHAHQYDEYYTDSYVPRPKSQSFPQKGHPSSSKSRGRRSPSPILYKIPSPYNASRPRPRPGFVKRVASRFREWVGELVRYARRHPFKAGLLSLLPIVALGGLMKGLVKAGEGLIGWIEDSKRRRVEREGKEDDKLDASSIFGQFSKFAGSKSGPLDGVLKVIQLLINHWCKLTPSPLPRTASILMELYFLEPWKL